MQNATTRRTRGAAKPKVFPPLEQVTSPTVTTAAAAHYLLRSPQTLRLWASDEKYPAGLRPIRIGNLLGWPVAGIRRILGVQ